MTDYPLDEFHVAIGDREHRNTWDPYVKRAQRIRVTDAGVIVLFHGRGRVQYLSPNAWSILSVRPREDGE